MQKHSVSSNNPLYFTRHELNLLTGETSIDNPNEVVVTAQPYYTQRHPSANQQDSVFDDISDPHYSSLPADDPIYINQPRLPLPSYQQATVDRMRASTNLDSDVEFYPPTNQRSPRVTHTLPQHTLSPPPRAGRTSSSNQNTPVYTVDVGFDVPPPPIAPRSTSKQTTLERNENTLKSQSAKFNTLSNLADLNLYNDSTTGGPVEVGIDIGSEETIVKSSRKFQNSRPKNEDEYRIWLKDNFYHYFQPYVRHGGIPILEMERILKTDSNACHIRTGKLNQMLEKMDMNQDGKIDWNEFFKSVTIRRKQDLSKPKQWLISTIKAASPAVEQHKKRDKVDKESKYGKDKLDGEEQDEAVDSYLDAYNCRPPPIFIPLCCLAQIIFFAIYAVEMNAGPEWNHVTWTSGVPYYSPLLFDPAKRQEAWRFLSYMLLHAGYHHILFNLVIQLLLGIPLELVHKAWRVGPVFLVGVIGGSLCSSVFDHKINLVGASGGCYALMGAHIALVIMNWEEMQHEWLNCKERPLSFLCSGVIRLLFLFLLLGLDFGVALYKRYGLGEKTQTSFLAHIGGLVAGLLIGIPVLKNLDKKPWESVVHWISVIILIALFTAAVIYNAFYPNYGA